MTDQIIKECKHLIENQNFATCKEIICKAMEKEPHSAIPHNLMGILLEKENNHILAMKHFRAAYDLDPTYVPARYNIDQYTQFFYARKCAYLEGDCETEHNPHLLVHFNKNHIRQFHLIKFIRKSLTV